MNSGATELTELERGILKLVRWGRAKYQGRWTLDQMFHHLEDSTPLSKTAVSDAARHLCELGLLFVEDEGTYELTDAGLMKVEGM